MHIDTIIEIFLNILPKLMLVIISSLVLYLVVTRFIRSFTKRIVERSHGETHNQKDVKKRSETLSGLVVSIWRLTVIIGTIVIIVRILFADVDLGPIFASAGLIGVALGFGAQSLIKDLITGILIIGENQYRIGDVVEINGASGTVEKISTRTTAIRDVNGNVHYIPNGTIEHVINKTMDYSKSRFELSIAPEEDVDTVAKIVDTIGKKLSREKKWKEKIIEAPHFLMVRDITATGTTLIITGKTQASAQWSINAEMRRRILDEFEAQHIKLGLDVSSTAVAAKSTKNN